MTYHYDQQAADKVVSWIEKYSTHVKGELAGKPLKLAEWQREKIIKPAFGWKRSDGLRKYQRVFVMVPRKNGKTTICSPIALYLLCADGEQGAEVYSAAADRTQAGIIHEISKGMIHNSDELSKRLDVYRNSIVYDKTGSSYKALSADVKTKHGLNASGILFDELHTQPNRELWDVLTTSIGSRTQPLIITITTAGWDRTSICYKIYDYAKKVHSGIIKDESFLSVIYESKPEDDIYDPDVWRAVNPNYGISIREDYIQQEANRARNEPGYENTFRRLQLNQWTSSETRWIPDEIWMQSGGKLDITQLEGMDCYGGLDLASTRDICALVLSFKISLGVALLPFFFVPEQAVTDRKGKEAVNYDEWVRDGSLITTPGNVTDYNYIQKFIINLKEKYNVRSIAYDRWNASQLIINLQGDGVQCSPFGQGYQSMSAPTKEMEKLVYDKKLVHGGNPVLRWMISNVLIIRDAADNIKIHKGKSTDKVDGAVASVMAIGEMITKGATGSSVYEERGILTL